MRGDRVVVPKVLRELLINFAHRSHQGIVKTKKLLRGTVWFPGIDDMVDTAVSHCLSCKAATHKPTESLEPLELSKLPDTPWKEVSVDLNGPYR